MKTKLAAALAASIVASACSLHSPRTDSAGRLVVIGGALSRDNEAVYRSILAARDGAGPVCIVPTASASPAGSIESASAGFDRHGGAGTAAGLDISLENPAAATDPALVAQIRGCSGFFFVGGVQSRIIEVFRPNGVVTPALTAVFDRYRQGAVVSGSSAGAAIMTDPMIAGGTSASAVTNGATRAGGESGDEDAVRGVAITNGLGFFPGAIMDQHFLARGRIGRLIVAVAELDELDLGFGIDENTALVADGDVVRPEGASGVVVVDARGARTADRSTENMRIHLLGVGDTYNVRSRAVTVAADKAALPAGPALTVPEDVFARWTFLHVLHAFARSSETQITLPFEGGRIVLRKDSDFRAGSRAGTGVEDTPLALSVTGIRLDMHR